MVTLKYRSNICVSELGPNECTIHRASNDTGARWWLLWFCVNRETDAQLADFAVPVNPNGAFNPDGPGGKTWGLMRGLVGTWLISPSINVVNTGAAHPGEHEAPSLWHQTPILIDVPDDVWTREAP